MNAVENAVMPSGGIDGLLRRLFSQVGEGSLVRFDKRVGIFEKENGRTFAGADALRGILGFETHGSASKTASLVDFPRRVA